MSSESLFRRKFKSLNISKKFMYSFNLGFANSRHEHPDYHVPENVILENKSPHDPERDVVFFSSSQDFAIDVSQLSFVSDITDSLRFGQNENSFAEERNRFKIEFGPGSNEVAVDVPDDFVPYFKSPPTSPRHTSATSLEASRFSFDHPLSSISSDVTHWNKSKELSRNSTPISKTSQISPTYNNSVNFNFGKPLNYKNSVVGREALMYEQTKLNSTFGRPTEKMRDAIDFPEIPPTYPRSSSESGLVRNSGGKVKPLQTFDQVLAAVDSLDSETTEETLSRKKLLKDLKTEVLERVKMEVNLISVNKINSIDELKQNVEVKKILSQLNKSKILLDYKNRSTKIILQEVVSQCLNSLRVSESYNETASRPPLQNNQSYISNHLLKLANEWSNTAPGNSVVSSTTSEPPFCEAKKTGIFKKRKKKCDLDCYFRRKVMSDQMVEITINKSFEPLGLTIFNDGRSVKIRRIVSGGMAEKSGYFHTGDEILMINKVNVKYKPLNEIESHLENLTGKIVFLISPKSPELTRRQFSRYVIISLKTQFNYNPAEDKLISHPEMGLRFQKGDILHVTDQKDKKWWKAYRNDERDQPINGIIPSIEFQTMRHQFLESLNPEDWTLGESRKKPKVKKNKKVSAQSSEETNTYEEVVLYNPRTYFTRPFVIIGPHNLFQKEFMRELKKSGLFEFGVTHTSRPKQVEEVEGINYYFVSRSRFKAMISANKFIRYGKFGKYLYGLSFDSMRTIAKSGKTGMFYYVDPVYIKPMRDNGLMPYVVFFQPPLVERWKKRKSELQNETQEAFRKLVQECINIEDNYGHFIDATFVYTSASEAFEEIVNKVNFLSSHLQWVPSTWVQNEHYSL